MFRLPSSAHVISMVALIVALGGAGYSATGGNFILGHSNVATTPTALNASLNHRTLSLGNPNPGAAATALGLIVPAGKPPMFVSSTGRVDRLNADMVDGLSANQLARVALDFDADVVSSVLFSDEAQITIQAPQAGFVLVNGALHFSTGDPDCAPCFGHMYIRDETTLATSNVTLASVANGEEAAAAVTWVFPVAAGARTFSLEAGKFPGAATHEVEFVNPMLTGLFVPFGSAGTGVLSLTSTDAEGTAKLGRLQRDGTRAVMR